MQRRYRLSALMFIALQLRHCLVVTVVVVVVVDVVVVVAVVVVVVVEVSWCCP